MNILKKKGRLFNSGGRNARRVFFRNRWKVVSGQTDNKTRARFRDAVSYLANSHMRSLLMR